jgi:hypothetical protein
LLGPGAGFEAAEGGTPSQCGLKVRLILSGPREDRRTL